MIPYDSVSEQLSQVACAAGDVLSSVVSRVQCAMHKVGRCWKFHEVSTDLRRSHKISDLLRSLVEELRPGFDLAGSSSLLQGSEPRG